MSIYLVVIFFSFGTNRNRSYKIESDGKYHYQYVISLYLDNDIDFTNNYRLGLSLRIFTKGFNGSKIRDLSFSEPS